MSIHDPDSESKRLFELHTRNLLDAVELCLQKGLVLPSLILIYAGIDAMSWLSMAKGQNKVRGHDFAKWTEDYLFPELPYPIVWFSGWDLYGARCALLHSHSAKSRMSASGTASEILYEDDGGNAYVDLKLNAPKPPIVLNVQHLAEAFAKAVGRFGARLLEQPELAERVYGRAHHWFYKGHWADRRLEE